MVEVLERVEEVEILKVHHHRCACGDYWVCHQEVDQCPRAWTCPACEDTQMAEYFYEMAEGR